ncbi:helix-turn-helix domain-containing protein [Rhodovulum sp.]|uniref:helix-turn-helix domain-containing protein n=1 Tax=Rhodovulum sp. TaxID=34009 RepID=UPI00257AB10D|nr:helix-turn-helix transcriptional regulator [Rhodovulum sp.]
MTIDGAKLRTLRLQKGMSQEKLGLLTNLNKRTIQRAENGELISIESLAFIADALEVEPQALRGRQQDVILHGAPPQTTRQGEVVLVPVTRGSRLVNTLRDAFMAKFEYEAEPTEDNLPLLEEIAEILNAAWENPWEPPSGRFGESTDAELLRLQAKANRVIPSLQDQGIMIFMGTYSSLQQQPRYDIDEGHMYIRDGWPRERVTNVRVVVSDDAVGHLTRIPGDYEDLEEIPF